jgi:hypothetical protein
MSGPLLNSVSKSPGGAATGDSDLLHVLHNEYFPFYTGEQLQDIPEFLKTVLTGTSKFQIGEFQMGKFQAYIGVTRLIQTLIVFY